MPGAFVTMSMVTPVTTTGLPVTSTGILFFKTQLQKRRKAPTSVNTRYVSSTRYMYLLCTLARYSSACLAEFALERDLDLQNFPRRRRRGRGPPHGDRLPFRRYLLICNRRHLHGATFGDA